MKILKVLILSLAMALSPLTFSQAGGSSASGAAGSLSSGVIAAIAAAVLLLQLLLMHKMEKRLPYQLLSKL